MNQDQISVTIIIPVYNDKSSLLKLLPVLTEKSYPYPVEIFVVDNASTDGTAQIVNYFKNVHLLQENEHKNSPYSARNRGIEASEGDIIVLLDSTCIPDSNWLNNGIEFLFDQNSDIVGGDVRFDFEGNITAGKIYDSLTNIKMKESIEKKGVAKTANLFIRKSVFDKVGMFPEGIRSGADVIWTGNAKRNGLSLDFCESAIVYKKARGFAALVKKQWRVGLHQPIIWKETGNKKNLLSLFIKLLKPVNPLSVKKLIADKGTTETNSYFLRIIFVAQVIKWVATAANIKGLIQLNRK